VISHIIHISSNVTSMENKNGVNNLVNRILDILFKIDDSKLKDIAVFLTKYENNTHFIQFTIQTNLICLKLLFI
jgi:uncharacterized tellurite resistance protein B-like protein